MGVESPGSGVVRTLVIATVVVGLVVVALVAVLVIQSWSSPPTSSEHVGPSVTRNESVPVAETAPPAEPKSVDGNPAVCSITVRSPYPLGFENTGAGTVAIRGLVETVEHLPRSELLEIERMLCATLGKNVYDSGDYVIHDAVIREGSFSQKQPEDIAGEVIEAFFLVDIESLRQTYYVGHYWWLEPPDDEARLNYPLVVGCPQPKDLIYGSFDKCNNSYDQ